MVVAGIIVLAGIIAQAWATTTTTTTMTIDPVAISAAAIIVVLVTTIGVVASIIRQAWTTTNKMDPVKLLRQLRFALARRARVRRERRAERRAELLRQLQFDLARRARIQQARRAELRAELRRWLGTLSDLVYQVHRVAERALVGSGLQPIDLAGLPVGADTSDGQAAAAYQAASINGAGYLLQLLENSLPALSSAVHIHEISTSSASYVLSGVLSHLWQWLLMPAKPADPVVGRLCRIWHHFAQHPTLKSPTVAVELSKWCKCMRRLANDVATPAALLAVVSRCPCWHPEQVKELWPAICAVITWWPNEKMDAHDAHAAQLLVWYLRHLRDGRSAVDVASYMNWRISLRDACAALERGAASTGC
jgi:hypothetical protein